MVMIALKLCTYNKKKKKNENLDQYNILYVILQSWFSKIVITRSDLELWRGESRA